MLYDAWLQLIAAAHDVLVVEVLVMVRCVDTQCDMCCGYISVVR